MRIALWSCVRKAFRLSPLYALAILAFLALGQGALAQGNNHTFSCAQGFNGTLCKAGQGGGQNCTGPEGNPVDLLNVTGTSPSSVVSFSFSGVTGTSQITVNGQGNTTSPSNTNPVTVPPNPGTMSGPGDADTVSEYQVLISSNAVTKSSATYTVSCTNPARASLSITKSANPTTYTGAGQNISYSYTVTNNGNVQVTNVAVTDNKINAVTCLATTLAPGASTTCSGTYQTTAGDVGAGSVTNIASASGKDPGNNTVTSPNATATITLATAPSLALTKSANPTTYTAAGQNINYSYTVTNNGNAQITNIAVTDNKINAVTCLVTTLAPGASTTCSGTYQTTAGDVGAGSVTNIASASGKDPGNNTVTSPNATATITFVAQPGLALTKAANPTIFTGENETINYSYTVTNSGNVQITNLVVTDNKIATVTCVATTLAPGASTTCAGTYVTTAADVAATSVTNIASASGKDPGNNTVTSPNATATITLNGTKRTTEVIQNFLYRRADQLLSNEPDRNRLIRRLPGSLWGGQNTQTAQAGSTGSTFTAAGGQGEGTRIAFATSLSQLAADKRAARQKKPDDQMMGLGAGSGGYLKDDPPLPVWNYGFDLWVEGHYTHFEDDQGKADRSGKLGVMYFGADYLINPGLLVGALAQFDWMEDSSNTLKSSVDGRGWMVGPYMSARLSENIFFDARAAWGESDNSISPFGTYEDSFQTKRWLVRGNLTGNWNFGHWRLTPSASVARIEEDSDAYTDSLGALIPGQNMALGRVTFGPEIGYRYFASDGNIIEPHMALQGLWDFEKPDTLTLGSEVVGPDDFRGKLEAGVMLMMPEGASVRATGAYDGIGSDDFHAYSGQMWVNLPLH
jgi:uncharacterized repeat protein (TIGR01451 family)